MGYKRILVTVDGSKFSEQAFEHVVRIADPSARIHILSVIASDPVNEVAALVNARSQVAGSNDQSQWPPTGADINPYDANARQKYVEELGDWLAQAGFDVTNDVRSGDVVEEILDVANQHFEVVVIATHGRTGAAKMVTGSVTDAVLQQAPCPVFVIRAQTA